MTSNADLKLVLLGNASTGKTCLFNRYIYKDFGKTSITIGAYYSLRLHQGRCVAVWDTSGEEKFGSLTSFYTRNAHCCIICFDLTDANSFLALEKWVSKIVNEGVVDCVIAIVGTKLDIVQQNPSLRKVDSAQAKAYAKSLNAIYSETSAKSGLNVEGLFQKVIDTAIKNLLVEQGAPSNPYTNNPNKIDIEADDKKKESSTGCC
jgi:small GTP-binding protein